MFSDLKDEILTERKGCRAVPQILLPHRLQRKAGSIASKRTGLGLNGQVSSQIWLDTQRSAQVSMTSRPLFGTINKDRPRTR